MITNNIKFGIVGGIVLYLLLVAVDILYAVCTSSSIVIIAFFVSGVIISTVVVLTKNMSFISAVVRSVIMLASYAICLFVGGEFQLVPWLRNALNISYSSYADDVQGMIQLTFLLLIVTICIISSIIVWAKRFFIKQT